MTNTHTPDLDSLVVTADEARRTIEALVAEIVALHGGNRVATVRTLKAHGYTVSEGALRRWEKHSYSDNTLFVLVGRLLALRYSSHTTNT